MSTVVRMADPPMDAFLEFATEFADGTDIDGFPAVEVGRIAATPPTPNWALRHDDLPVPASSGPNR